MKSVLFICPHYYPRFGGVEKHVMEVSLHLRRCGYKVSIITEKYDSGLKGEEIVNGVKIIRIYYPRIKYLGLFMIWGKLLYKYKLFLKSDIIHIHDVFIWYLPLRFLLFRKKVYITFHGWEGKYPIPYKNILIKKLSWRLSAKSICIGNYIEKYYGIKTDAVTFGGVKTSHSHFKKKKLAIFLGRLEEDTGLKLFISIAPFLKKAGYKITFCGDGVMREQCKKHGEVLGFVNPVQYLKSAKICFGSGYLSVLESIAYKCITVAGYQNILKRDYYISSPFSRWVIMGNSKIAITEKLKKTLKNKISTQISIKEAYQWSKKQTWKNITNIYLYVWNLN